MARKTVKQKAIEHYDRMIEYAEQSKEKDCTLMLYSMIEDIQESTGSDYCPYCIKNKFNNLLMNEACSKCKLNIKNNKFNCCNGLYIKMTKSETIRTWIERAKKVRQYIIDNG